MSFLADRKDLDGVRAAKAGASEDRSHIKISQSGSFPDKPMKCCYFKQK